MVLVENVSISFPSGVMAQAVMVSLWTSKPQAFSMTISIEHKRMEESQEDIERLDSIPGIGKKVAEQMIAELGTNIKEQFPTATLWLMTCASKPCSWTLEKRRGFD
ncbi:hypothetical protein ACQ0QQ_22345 [Lysinibacillus sphaericus]